MRNLEAAATISANEIYRYFLSRTWDPSGQVVTFIGLNPSTADASNDDPTIRRCIRFAKNWGYGSLWMVNLFAFRATQPARLLEAADPIGSENDFWLDKAVNSAQLVIAAWGNHGALLNRASLVRERFYGKLNALTVTERGMPGHPLYLRADSIPFPYR